MESKDLNNITEYELEMLYSDIIETPEFLLAAKGSCGSSTYAYYSSSTGICCYAQGSTSIVYCLY